MKTQARFFVQYPFVTFFYSAYLLMWASLIKPAMNLPAIEGSGNKCASGLVAVIFLMSAISFLYLGATLIQMAVTKQVRLYGFLALLIALPVIVILVWGFA